MRLLNAVFTSVVLVCCAQPSFAQAPQLQLPDWGTLPTALQRHGSVILKNRLYVIGGATPGGWLGNVASAPINENGTLGMWRSELSLPEARGYLTNCVVTDDNHIYILGGNVAKTPQAADDELYKCNDVLWTRVGKFGKSKGWQRGAKFPGQPMSCVAACLVEGHLIAIGGSTDAGPVSTVLTSAIQADGSPGEWTMTNPLPEKTWFHGAAYVGGRIYVWGGLNQKERSNPSVKTWSAALSRGLINGAWREEAPLPKGTYAAAAIGDGKQLLTIGGRYANDLPTNTVSFGEVSPSGGLAWKSVTTNLKSQWNHAAAVDTARGILFVTGGNSAPAPGAPGEMLSTIQAFKVGM